MTAGTILREPDQKNARTSDRRVVQIPCTHCGEPTRVVIATGATDPEHVFCCSGCRQVYELIHHLQLDQFYELRNASGAESQPVRASDRGIEIFDDWDLLANSKPQETSDGYMESVLALQGLHCGACSWLIENAANQTSGWLSARVNMNDHSVRVLFDPARISLRKIAETLLRLGYQPIPLTDRPVDASRLENRRLLTQIAVAGFCAANTMWIAIALYSAEATGAATSHYQFMRLCGAGLGLAAVLGPGRTFFRGAMASLRTRTPHMDLPVALGLSVGTTIGLVHTMTGAGEVYFDSLAVLVFLLLIGRWIQFRQQHRAAKAVDLMLRLTPHHAQRILDDGSTQRVEVSTLLIGQRVWVGAGDNIPVDGVIERGESAIDRSLLTGETVPVAAGVGERVCAGTLNLLRPIEIAVSATGADSRIGKVMTLVENATTDKPAMVQLANRIGGVFVVVVMALAVITWLAWLGSGWQTAAENATTLLIVACPCALALATPLAIAVALGRAARRQILIRDGSLLQQMAGAGTIWFDKTGTLTVGKPAVVDFDGPEPELGLQYAAAIEHDCVHPLAGAIVRAAEERGLERLETDVPTAVAAGGIHGRAKGRNVIVGNPDFVLSMSDLELGSWENSIAKIEAEGRTPILVVVANRLLAVLAIADRIRPEARSVVAQLQSAGWQVGVLSGDNRCVVQRVAERLGIPSARALGERTPEQKLEQIRASRSESRRVVMVGDGANDAAALAAADVGVAVRGGAEVSMQSAPVYVGSGRLLDVLALIEGARATQKLILVTFAASLGYNALAVVLAATGQISPLVAAVLMPISSVTVLAITIGWRTFSAPRPDRRSSGSVTYGDLYTLRQGQVL